MSSRVSCIITCYNQEAFIAEALESVVGQTYSDLQIVVVDDGSTDGSLEIIRSYMGDERLELATPPPTGTPAGARNVGISMATGAYVAFLDGDDRWHPQKLERQLPLFSKVGTVGVGCATKRFGPGASRAERKGRARTIDTHGLLHEGGVALSSLVVRSPSPRFDDRVEFKYVEDFELQLRLLSGGGQIHSLAEPLVDYRVHADGGSNDLKNASNILNVLGEVDFAEIDCDEEEARALHYLSIGIQGLRTSMPREARGYLLNAVKLARGRNLGKGILALVASFAPSSLVGALDRMQQGRRI